MFTTHQVLAYADDVNLIGDDIITIERNADVLLNTCKDIGMIANVHIKIGNNSYEKVKTFEYLGSLLTNQNSIQEEINCKLKTGNSRYFSVQTLLSSRLLSNNLKIKIFKTIILPVVLYGCEAW